VDSREIIEELQQTGEYFTHQIDEEFLRATKDTNLIKNLMFGGAKFANG
jgi:hypothetical protein